MADHGAPGVGLDAVAEQGQQGLEDQLDRSRLAVVDVKDGDRPDHELARDEPHRRERELETRIGLSRGARAERCGLSRDDAWRGGVDRQPERGAHVASTGDRHHDRQLHEGVRRPRRVARRLIRGRCHGEPMPRRAARREEVVTEEVLAVRRIAERLVDPVVVEALRRHDLGLRTRDARDALADQDDLEPHLGPREDRLRCDELDLHAPPR